MKVREEEAPGTLTEPEPRPQELSPFSCSASPTKSSPCILLWGHPRSWGGEGHSTGPLDIFLRGVRCLWRTRASPHPPCARGPACPLLRQLRARPPLLFQGTVLCDIILLNFLKGADQYKAKKFEEVSGVS